MTGLDEPTDTTRFVEMAGLDLPRVDAGASTGAARALDISTVQGTLGPGGHPDRNGGKR